MAARFLNRKEVASGRQIPKQKRSGLWPADCQTENEWLVVARVLNSKEVASARQTPKQAKFFNKKEVASCRQGLKQQRSG